jgi:hypothetical protein
MPTEAVPLEGLTDQDLFDEANSDEPAADEAVVAEPVEQDEQPRDEAGRFAEKAAEEPAEPIAAAPAERPAVDDNAPQVPSWRVREINDEKRALAERVATFESQAAQWQREQQELRQRLASLEKPPEPPAKPDPLLDPEGYEKHIFNQMEERFLNNQRESSLANAHKQYKGEFEEAYAAAQKQVDPALKARMQQSRDPGETLMEWHREMKTRAEVGSDPNAYFDKRFEEYLKDPANQAKVLERIRGGAQPQPGARQTPAVDLPPSLTRATNASREINADDDDISNDGLWRHANA